MTDKLNVANVTHVTHVFETLYGKDATNKMKEWTIKVINEGEHSIMVYTYGQQGGKKVECTQVVSMGKNLGKKNETSHFEQALQDAQSKWNKKRDIDGYTTTPFAVAQAIAPMRPMLAQEYKKHSKKVAAMLSKSLIMIQPKLDGYRMIYNTTTGEMTTRQGKPYTIIKESMLYKALRLLPTGHILDGELYTSSVSFETLGVLRKTKQLTEQDKLNLAKIEYHVYDLIDTNKIFKERNKALKELLHQATHHIVYVPTITVQSEEDIINHHRMFVEQGYEGTMIRNMESLYKCNFRSSDLLKYKDFQDAEFTIVDYTFEKNTSGDDNLVVWIIETQNKIKCNVRPQGVKAERTELYKKCVQDFQGQFQGKKLWTKFFEYTTDGSLRFPTTARNTVSEYIRDEIL